MFLVVSDRINTSKKLNEGLDKLNKGESMENVVQSRSIKTSSKGIFFTEDTVYHPLFLFNNSTIQQIST